jgi:hypothetical protein
MPHRFKCPTCDRWHEGFPDVGYDQPHYTKDILGAERVGRIFLTSDLCVLDEQYFFIRCVLILKVRGANDDLTFGVWSSLSEANFLRYRTDFDRDMSDWEPMFGYLSNRLPHYPDTLALKLAVQTGSIGTRPTLRLEPTDHPLAIDQQHGIALEKVGIVAPFLTH